MKKKLGIVSVVCLALVMAMALTACSAAGGIKKNFEKEGYTVTSVKVEDDSSAEATLKALGLSDDQLNNVKKCELITVSKNLNSAVIIAFPGASDLKDYFTVEKEDGSKDTSAYDKAKEEGYIKGNCLLITISSDAKEIFNK